MLTSPFPLSGTHQIQTVLLFWNLLHQTLPKTGVLGAAAERLLRSSQWSAPGGSAHAPSLGSQSVSRSAVSDSWRPHGLQPTRLLCPRESPGKNPGLGCHFLLQEPSLPRDAAQVSCTTVDSLPSEPLRQLASCPMSALTLPEAPLHPGVCLPCSPHSVPTLHTSCEALLRGRAPRCTAITPQVSSSERPRAPGSMHAAALGPRLEHRC